MNIAGVQIKVPVMNAACSVAKTFYDVRRLSQTNIGAVLIGSVTLKPRSINPGPNLQLDDIYALNSFGMPNKGLSYYRDVLQDMASIIRDSGKKAIVSIAGFSTGEYEELALLGDAVDLLELNFGCPNVLSEGGHAEIICFNSELVGEVIQRVKSVTRTPLMIKVSPYSNPAQLKDVAKVLKQHQVAAVVTSNTFPNGVFTSQGEGLSAQYAGISGKALKPIAMGQVHQFRQNLPKSIAVVGVGGIEIKDDVEDYLSVGADMVQAATLIVRDGHAAIDQLV